jgi:hypothetical protein
MLVPSMRCTIDTVLLGALFDVECTPTRTGVDHPLYRCSGANRRRDRRGLRPHTPPPAGQT